MPRPSTVPASLKSGYQKSMGQQPVIEVVRVRKKKGDDLAAAGSHISRFLCSSLLLSSYKVSVGLQSMLHQTHYNYCQIQTIFNRFKNREIAGNKFYVQNS